MLLESEDSRVIVIWDITSFIISYQLSVLQHVHQRRVLRIRTAYSCVHCNAVTRVLSKAPNAYQDQALTHLVLNKESE